ncbi:Site-specific DNA-methyltransferase (adenine-specific) [Nitrosococcus halophilus Nc 4]|uniref:site-specific DNA-methyltransferase (adenine-specific) n=1 Tax=Nitrosococcus halophilus (strain Nc4) TaxID=472759 RepID=D5C0T7_NITHN|nr:site-specific DNA-methyltransferase [Nitrosococcus halophilus]ADE16410.1 Site-specific DNA-methyltransferase (adenine-specific) [Nitrosococcus halophilus Nc 4]
MTKTALREVKEPKPIAITSPDQQKARLNELKRLFPDLFDGEGNLDEKALRALVSPDGLALNERFRFEWAGKQQSKRYAFTPSRATLVADPTRSVDFESTENLIIEGDNLEVLKLLQATYFERVKCIYIDPPYNTGNDFIYPDDYRETKTAYWKRSGAIKDGVRLTAVTEASGRRHSNWLNMMQSRLLLARQLLRDDGIIFISIDDNEVAHLKLLASDIFGAENFIGQVTVLCNPKGRSQDKYLANCHEFLLIYSKSPLENGAVSVPKSTDEVKKNFPLRDEGGVYRELELRNTHREFGRHNRPNLYYPFYVSSTGKVSLDPKDGDEEIYPNWDDGFEGCWTWGKDRARQDLDKIVARKVSGRWKIFRKAYAAEPGNAPVKKLKSIWSDKKYHTEKGQTEFNRLFEKKEKIFQSPKSVDLIADAIRMATDEESIVMDFFAGSGTTAHAVFQVNAEDGKKRKFILVQVPEITAKDSLASKEGLSTISSLCIERVRLAGQKTREEHPDAEIDTGFRVYRLTDSYFPQNFYTPDPNKTEAENVAALEEHLEASRQHLLFGNEDFDEVVTEIALKNGYGLFYELEKLAAFTSNAVYRLRGNDKAALLCLDATLNEETIEALAQHSDEQLIVSSRALDTTKKWALQAAFKDNLHTA